MFVAPNFLEYEGAVRLFNGSYASSGRLEVFLYNQWGAVCDPTFSQISAIVVCKQLGYNQVASFMKRYRNVYVFIVII